MQKGDSGGVRQDSGAGASGIYYECKRAVPLRFQRQLHTPNRRYTFTGDLRGIVDRMPTLQQTHYRVHNTKWTVTQHRMPFSMHPWGLGCSSAPGH